MKQQISFRLQLIAPSGGVSYMDPTSPLVSIASTFFLQSESCDIMSPLASLPFTTVLYGDLCHYNTFHAFS